MLKVIVFTLTIGSGLCLAQADRAAVTGTIGTRHTRWRQMRKCCWCIPERDCGAKRNPRLRGSSASGGCRSANAT
jgi:hypothetical protein